MLETAFLLRELSRFDEAAQIFKGATVLRPSTEVPLVGLGTVEFQRRNFERAHQAYEKALEINPDSTYAKVHRAETMIFEGKKDLAITELKKIIETAPDSSDAKTASALVEIAQYF